MKVFANSGHKGSETEPSKEANKEHEPGYMKGAHLHCIEAKQFYFFEWFIICLHGNEIEEDERIGRCFLGRTT